MVFVRGDRRVPLVIASRDRTGYLSKPCAFLAIAQINGGSLGGSRFDVKG